MHTNLPHVKDMFGLSLPVPVTENDMDSPTQRSLHELTFDEIQNEGKLLSQEYKDFDEDPLSFEEAIDVLMEACKYYFVLLEKRKGMQAEIHE